MSTRKQVSLAFKVFDISTIKGLKSAERYKRRLENVFDKVTVTTFGLSRIQIIGQRNRNIAAQ